MQQRTSPKLPAYGKNPDWQTLVFNENDPQLFRCGPLHLWLKTDHDILFTFSRHIDELSEQPDPPEDKDWQRWVCDVNKQPVSLSAALPDLPLVVYPEVPLHLPPGISSKIFVPIPLWISVNSGKSELFSTCSFPLTKTWFGNFAIGELCYALPSGDHPESLPNVFRPWFIYCPIEIRNGDEENLSLEKIRLDTNQLSIYEKEDQYWTNLVRVHYQGSLNLSEIKVVNGPPQEASAATRLREARQKHKRSFTAKTFSSLADLAGLDFLSR